MGLNELNLDGKELNAEDLEEIAGGVIDRGTNAWMKYTCHVYKLGGSSKEDSLKHIAEVYAKCSDSSNIPTYEELVAWFDANWDSL